MRFTCRSFIASAIAVSPLMRSLDAKLCWALKSDGKVLNQKGTVRQQLMTVYVQDDLVQE